VTNNGLPLSSLSKFCDSSRAGSIRLSIAGVPRLMTPKAKIGFHAASINGQEKGNGNAATTA
jgi:hypothetical protein